MKKMKIMIQIINFYLLKLIKIFEKYNLIDYLLNYHK